MMNLGFKYQIMVLVHLQDRMAMQENIYEEVSHSYMIIWLHQNVNVETCVMKNGKTLKQRLNIILYSLS